MFIRFAPHQMSQSHQVLRQKKIIHLRPNHRPSQLPRNELLRKFHQEFNHRMLNENSTAEVISGYWCQAPDKKALYAALRKKHSRVQPCVQTRLYGTKTIYECPTFGCYAVFIDDHFANQKKKIIESYKHSRLLSSKFNDVVLTV